MLSKLSRSVLQGSRALRSPAFAQQKRDFAKVVCVLYDDPVNGYPKTYARDDVPKIKTYPDQFGKPGRLIRLISLICLITI
jgi:hypothetical protein